MSLHKTQRFIFYIHKHYERFVSTCPARLTEHVGLEPDHEE